MDVNLEELDQIIDGGMRAPLSESDGEKLKAVLHILAERAKPRWRTTEKTRAVLPQTPSSEAAAEKRKAGGSARTDGTWAQRSRPVYGRADRSGATQKTSPRRHLPGMRRGQSLPPEGT